LVLHFASEKKTLSNFFFEKLLFFISDLHFYFDFKEKAHQFEPLENDVERRVIGKKVILAFKWLFRKRISLTFGNPATFMATPQHLINASAKASVPTPNTLIKYTVNIQIIINSYTFDNKFQY